MTPRKTVTPQLRTVTVMLQLPPVVYRALVRTATIRDMQVHTLIEQRLTAAVTGEAGPEVHRRITAREEAAWVSLWRLGWTDSQIARESGRRQNIVSRHLRKLDCPAHGKGGAKPKLRALQSVDQEAAA